MNLVGENGHATGPEPDAIIVDPAAGNGFTITGPATDVLLDNITINDATNGIQASGPVDLTLNNVIITNATNTGVLSTATGDLHLTGGTFDGLDISGADDILLDGGNISSTDDVSLSANNSVDIDTNLDAGNSTVTITANSDGAGSEGFENCGFAISTTNDTADAISITVNTLLGGTGIADIDLLVAGTTSGPAGGRVTVDANAGAITDCNGAANNITAGNAVLRGLAGVGSAIDVLETTVSRLEAAGGSGGVYDTNTGDLSIGGISPLTGLSTTTGNIDVRVDGAVTIEEKVATTGATGNVLLQANENAGVGRNLTLNVGVTVSSPNGNVSLLAGDDLTTQAGSVISTPTGSITLQGDFNDADAAGTAININSQLVAGTGTSVIGGNGNDTYQIAYPLGVSNSGTVTITDAGGTDAATVAGTPGPDELYFTTTNPPTTASTEQVTRNNSTDEPIIIPSSLESFRLFGSTGNDNFYVQPTTLFPLTIDGGAPTFGQPGVPPGDHLILDTLGNSFSFVGTSILVNGAPPFQVLTPTNIESIDLAPVSPGPVQRYDFNSRSVIGGVYVQSPTQPGWTGVTADTVYSPGLGYGWSEPLSAVSGGTSTSADAALRNDAHVYIPALANDVPTFTANVSNGWIGVTVDYGHPTLAMDGLRIINADTGEYLATNLSTDLGETDHLTFFIQITDGTLNLRFEDVVGSRMIAIDGIDIRPAALLTMGFTNHPAGALNADGTTVDNFTLAGGPSSLLVTVEPSLGTVVGVDADPTIDGFQVLTDAAGNANVMIQRPSGAGTSTILMTTPTGEDWTFETIDYDLLGALVSGRNFDFNSGNSPNQAGYQPVATTDNYTSARGYGWLGGTQPQSFSNGTTFTGPLANASNDGQRGTGPMTFRVDLPNGLYEVHALLGDLADHFGMDIAANGLPVFTDLSLPRNTITEDSLLVTVTNGHLDITFSPGSGTSLDPSWIINALQILPAALVGSITPVNEGTVPADGTTISTIDATSTLPQGTLVTIESSLGTITTPDADPSTAGTQVLVGPGGLISFDLKSPTIAGIPTVEWRTLDEATRTTASGPAFLNFALPAVRRFDFGPGFSDATMTNVAAGFTGARTNNNPETDGFGWITPVGVSNAPTPPTVGTPALYSDGHSASGSAVGTFLVQANPATLYDIRLYFGSICMAYSNVQITVEGLPPQVISTTPANLFQIVTFLGASDLNGDGFISIQFQSLSNGGWTVAGMDIATSAVGLPPAAPLLAKVVSNTTNAAPLTVEQLQPLVALAKSYYEHESLTALQRDRLQTVQFSIVDLNDQGALGLAGSRLIEIDDNGAGLGWDTTPESVDADRYDLLSVLVHELGHVLGAGHDDHGVMQPTLAPGERLADIDDVFANW